MSHDWPVKHKVLLFILLVFAIFPANAQTTVAQYKACLEKHGEDPVEYIFRLFEKADVVILGERDHRDITQYDFISRLLADKRFSERIGYVYTEVGCTNKTESANKLIKTDWASEEDFQKALREHLRYEDYGFLWEKTNRSTFLDNLYHINQKLPHDKRITLGLTDIAFDWTQWTSPDKYKWTFPNKYRKWARKNTYFHKGQRTFIRDREMAKNFLSQYKKQKAINGHQKALVIWNEPHAMRLPHGKCAGYRTKKSLGEENVKIVCLNWYIWSNPGEFDFAASSGPGLIDDGRWDAAFQLTGNKPVGFDLKGTPFGDTKAWHYNDGTSWKDLSDGYIFLNPFYEFIGSIGIKNILNDECKPDMQRRLNLMADTGEMPSNDWDEMKLYYNTVRTFPIPDERTRKHMNEQLDKQLQQAQEH